MDALPLLQSPSLYAARGRLVQPESAAYQLWSTSRFARVGLELKPPGRSEVSYLITQLTAAEPFGTLRLRVLRGPLRSVECHVIYDLTQNVTQGA